MTDKLTRTCKTAAADAAAALRLRLSNPCPPLSDRAWTAIQARDPVRIGRVIESLIGDTAEEDRAGDPKPIEEQA